MSDNDLNLDDLDELENMFGGEDEEIEQNEKIILSQNLEGFAHCFPDWDLHPPVRK
ncbi:MAG: hypothetical protein K6E62_02845 [Lachnospiraceae bacterium]|nr:hypothetical protein [Lachnospiraceae bacterium]